MGMGVIAVSSLGALVVIASIKNVDILSTVALTLALLSFAAQLIVTLAQGSQSATVNADTKSALADMRATTGSLLTNQKDQFNTVLGAALRQAIPAAVEDVASERDQADDTAGETSERASDLLAAVTYRLDEALSASNKTNSKSYSPYADVQLITKRNRHLETYPSQEEGERLVPVILQLKPRALANFGRLVADATKTSRLDGGVPYRERTKAQRSNFEPLVEAGLAEKVIDASTGERAIRLTDDGWIAARLLRAVGESPQWAASLQ